MKKQVMTTAHQLTKESMARKEFGSRSYRYVFSQCLVRAWRAEKEAQKKKKAAGVLFGSPKQIAWASDIKHQSIERMNIKIERMKAKGRAQIVAAYTEIKKRVETETSASWFINELASYERQVRKLYNI